MIKQTLGVSALAVLIALPTAFASAASSQTELYNSYALAYGTLALETGLTGSASVGGNGGSADASADVDLNTSDDSGADTSTSDDSSATADDTADVGGQGALDLSITRDGISADTENSITSSSAVSSSADLEAYTSYMLHENENIQRAEFNENTVSVWYSVPAKLFGFMSVDMPVEVRADASGTVDIKYPWYSFMATGIQSSADLKASLENQIRTTLGDQSEGPLSARLQAMIVSDIQTAFAN